MSGLYLPSLLKEELQAEALKIARAEVAAASQPRIVAPDINAALRLAMQTGRPGVWGSDWSRHRREAEQYVGYHYVAISALANEVAQATVQVYRDETAIPQELWARWNKRHRGVSKHLPKALRLRKGYGDDMQELELVDPGHPLVRILMRPNPKQTGSDFRYEQVMQIRLTGGCLIWNVPNAAGLTVERYVLPTACVDPMAPRGDLPDGGWRVNPDYMPKMTDGQGFYASGSLGFFMAGQQTLPAEQVQIVGYAHPTTKQDFQSPISATALWTDSANAVDKARKAQMDNAGNPSLVVSVDPEINMSPEEFTAEKRRFLDSYAGATNNRAVLFMQGAKASILSHAAKEMDYGTAHGDLRDAELAAHTTHAMSIGAEVPGTYGAMAVAGLMREYNVIKPIVCKLSDHDTAFFAPQFGPGLTVWYEPESFEDPEVAAKVLELMLSGGNMVTVNEWRMAVSKLGVQLEPLPGKEGDEMAGKKPEPVLAPGMPGQPGKPGGGFGVKPKPPAASSAKRFEVNGEGEAIDAALAERWSRYLTY